MNASGARTSSRKGLGAIIATCRLRRAPKLITAWANTNLTFSHPIITATAHTEEAAELPTKQAGSLSCLAVNVTSSSVWVACEPASEADKPRREHRFGVELYRADGDQDQLDDYPAASESLEGARLEANLSSARLDEPLFALNRLRANTRYLARVRHLDAFENRLAEPAALVGFSTSRAESKSAEPGGSSGPASLDPVADARSRASLLSALISTRSADHGGLQQRPAAVEQAYSMQRNGSGHHRQAAPNQEQQQLRQSSNQPTSGFLAGLWSTADSATSSLLRVFGLAGEPSAEPTRPSLAGSSGQGARAHQQPLRLAAKPRAGQPERPASTQRLLDTSGLFLLTSVCLLLFSSVALLLFLNRRLAPSCLSFGRKRRSSPPRAAKSAGRKPSSESDLHSGSTAPSFKQALQVRRPSEASPPNKPVDKRGEPLTDGENAKTSEEEATTNQCRSTTTTSSIYDFYEPGPAVSLGNQARGPPHSASLNRFSSAQVIASSKTLDRRPSQLVAAGTRRANNTVCHEIADRVGKSRSSMCLKTMLMDTDEQQLQQRLVKLADLNRCLIGDANLSLLNGQSDAVAAEQGIAFERAAFEHCVQCGESNPPSLVSSQPGSAGYERPPPADPLGQPQSAFATGFVLCDVQRDYEASPDQTSGRPCSKQLLNFVVVQPEAAYGMALASPASAQQSNASDCDFRRYLNQTGGELAPALPMHPFNSNGDRQSSSLISDESSDLNAWSLPNGQPEGLQLDQRGHDQMQYIELLPTVDFLDGRDSGNHQLIGKMAKLNQGCAQDQTSSLARSGNASCHH